MFEVGQWYQIWLIEEGEEGSLSYQIVEYDHPLIKLRNPHMKDMVVNTSSPMFIRAQLSKFTAEEHRQADLEDELD